MSWLYLTVAGLLEIVWAISLKQSDGFSKLVPAVVSVTTMIASVIFLALALRGLPVGTAYAVWTGIGAVGVATVGILWLNEPATLGRVLCIALIAAGIVGLKLLTRSE